MLAIDALQPSCFFLNPTNSIMQHSNPENTIFTATDNTNTNSPNTSSNNGFMFQYPTDYYVNNEYLATSSGINPPANWSYSTTSSASMTPISPINANSYVFLPNNPNPIASTTTASECSSPISVRSPISTFDSSIPLIPAKIPNQVQNQMPPQRNPHSPNVMIASASAAAAATALAIGSVSPSDINSANHNSQIKGEKHKSPSLKSPSLSSSNSSSHSISKPKRGKSTSISNTPSELLEKKYQCQICGKYFRRDLPRHLRTHLEITRFECPFPREICPHKQGQFNRPYDFKKHLLHGHFIFDDQKKVRSFRDLHQKLSYTGTCRCGLRFTAGEWLDKHVLAGDNRCPFLVKIPKDNLAATRVLVSEQLQNASSSSSTPTKVEYPSQEMTYQQPQAQQQPSHQQPQAQQQPPPPPPPPLHQRQQHTHQQQPQAQAQQQPHQSQPSMQLQMPMQHSVEHPMQFQHMQPPQISPIQQQIHLPNTPQQLSTMVMQQITPTGLVHPSHAPIHPHISSQMSPQMPVNIYEQLHPHQLHGQPQAHPHHHLQSQAVIPPNQHSSPHQQMIPSNISVIGPDGQPHDQSTLHHQQFQ